MWETVGEVMLKSDMKTAEFQDKTFLEARGWVLSWRRNALALAVYTTVCVV
jgi:hypothetical protein